MRTAIKILLILIIAPIALIIIAKVALLIAFAIIATGA